MASSATLPVLKHKPTRRKRVNFPLWIGALIVSFVILIGIFGKDLAPRDPTEDNRIIQLEDGSWLTPPIPALKMLDFPLGTDRFGRDLYSQLLYAVRPTLVLVFIVASVRMALGLWIGVMAGWFTHPVFRYLNNFINTAATIPALIVALAAIAAVGADLGVWAFVIGLSITGWADTAQLVREQTRLTKRQVYIEASRAMGANDTQVIGRHLLRQIMPLIWVVFNLEVSGTMMAAAGLGFLGYYIGGDAFIIVDDAVAARVASQFELGQMLATTTEISLEPWGMVAAGSMVFISILGFNLLGEGLRQRLRMDELSSRGPLSAIQEAVSAWVENHLVIPVYQWSETGYFWPAILAAALLSGFGGMQYARYQEVQDRIVLPTEVKLFVPGGHLWANDGHDPYGTFWSEAQGPQAPQLLWAFNDQSGFTGGPVVDSRGQIYLLTNSGYLVALDAAGSPLWDVELVAAPVSSPALDMDGDLFVVGVDGSLTRISPEGELIWHFEQDIQITASEGAITDSKGNIYYPLSGLVQAVSPEGESLWRTVTQYFPHTTPPKLSPDEKYVYIQDSVLDAATGEQLETVMRELTFRFDTNTQRPIHIVDRTGRTHLLLGNLAIEWDLVEGVPEIKRTIFWPSGTFGLGNTANVGITPNNTLWAFYPGGFSQASIIWMDLDGSVLGDAQWPQRPSALIGIDSQSTYYFCGTPGATIECLSFPLGSTEENWRFRLPQPGAVAGGAVVEHRLYVTTQEGWLYAIGDE
jgi:ABC-type dipeptide/oligopeptide/nickel transport system permease subunit/outer membrane protein assembly factor BamB